MSAWADCALARHDYAAALPRTVAALEREGDIYNTIGQLTVVAAALAGQGRDTEAAELMGAGRPRRHRGRHGRTCARLVGGSFAGEPLTAAAARVGEAEWERMRANGRRMSLEQAIDWAVKLGTAER